MHWLLGHAYKCTQDKFTKLCRMTARDLRAGAKVI